MLIVLAKVSVKSEFKKILLEMAKTVMESTHRPEYAATGAATASSVEILSAQL